MPSNRRNATKLSELRANYLKALAVYQAQLEQLHSLTRLEPDALMSMVTIAHRLSGSGKAFGFPSVSDAGSDLESACQHAHNESPLNAAKTVEPHLLTLIECLDHLATGRSEQSGTVTRENRAFKRPDDSYPPGSITLLLVDDDPEFSAQLSDLLTAYDYRVHCLEDITQLSDAVERCEPLAILVDMDFYGKRLAGADQVATLRYSQDAPLPVIFISAFDSFEIRLAAVKAGGNHFLSKPLDENRLIAILRHELNVVPNDPYQVMLVDDDTELLRLYESVLVKDGYTVQTAYSAQSALEQLERQQPELILIDVHMPDCGGIELGQIIRQHVEFAHIPMLFMSATADTDLQLACARLANDEFINKPIEPWRLLMVVKSRVSRSRRLQTGEPDVPGLETHGIQDSLTALPTLKSFRRLTQQQLGQLGKDKLLAVLKIDIRDFHTINNLHGHFGGDQVLQRLAWQLSQCIGTTDLLCRESGDEFLVLTTDHHSKHSIDRLATALASAIEHLDTRGEPGGLSLSADIGIALGHESADSADELLHCADTALFMAKKSQSSDIRYYQPSMQLEERRRFTLAQSIKKALNDGEFTAFYQPILSVSGNRLVGFEALARWQHPSQGTLGPGSFIPIMEEQGLITHLTQQMLTQALLQLSKWQSIEPNLFMSINLSASDVQKPVFLETLKHQLLEHKLTPSTVTLEITETALLADWQQATHTIESLRALGVEMALDDFGTGYSSLSYLNRFHAAKLKIDQSFIRSWSQSGEEQLIRTIVQLGQTMGMQVIAEGVEKPDELDFLNGLACNYYQGFIAARPMLASEVNFDNWS